MSKPIRVDEDTYASLEALKGDEETFDELLSRLIEEQRAMVGSRSGSLQDFEPGASKQAVDCVMEHDRFGLE